MKILIAEDDQVLQNFYREYMEDWGYDFDMAANGSQAVAYARNNKGKYDLCLMNIEMPVMNGLRAAKIMRQKFSYFPIIAITANPDYRIECFQIGMDEFIGKPHF